jgi:hypothetical protein
MRNLGLAVTDGKRGTIGALDRRGIAHLSSNSLGLDLYGLFGYRLPRLKRDVHLQWPALQQQIGAAEKTTFTLAQRVR